MAKHTYPAIFEKEIEGGYSIYFPDVEGCYTQSEDIAEGIENAGDALCLMLYELEKQGKPIPTPTDIKSIALVGDNIVTSVSCDTLFYEDYFEGKFTEIGATSRGDFAKLEMFQTVRLATGEKGAVVEIFNDGEGYMIDILLPDGNYELRTVRPHEIAAIFSEIEEPFAIV